MPKGTRDACEMRLLSPAVLFHARCARCGFAGVSVSLVRLYFWSCSLAANCVVASPFPFPSLLFPRLVYSAVVCVSLQPMFMLVRRVHVFHFGCFVFLFCVLGFLLFNAARREGRLRCTLYDT